MTTKTKSVQREIRIVPTQELPSGLMEDSYLINFSRTVYENLKRLNPQTSLKITGFEDARHLRRFEKALLKDIHRYREVSTGRYLRTANELELNYTITGQF